jgi:predicted transcriptional regulator
MNETTLHVRVGGDVEESLRRAADSMKAIERGQQPEPYFNVGFEDIGQMLAVFTPKRWELIGVLRSSGPLTVAELARCLRRDDKNVHGDVESLMEWMTVERDEQGCVFVPWSEIIVDMHLPKQAAA